MTTPLPTTSRGERWAVIARRIRVPMGFLFAGVFLVHLYFVPPSRASLLLSLVLVVPGAALRAYASGYVRKNAELATTGPYAYTRNPLYLGSILMAFGFATASRSWVIAALLVALFAIIYGPTILSEEAFLRRTFPEFDAYARRVPRLMPRITHTRLSGQRGEAGGFSMALYLRHREYNSVLGALAIYAALLARTFLAQRHF